MARMTGGKHEMDAAAGGRLEFVGGDTGEGFALGCGGRNTVFVPDAGGADEAGMGAAADASAQASAGGGWVTTDAAARACERDGVREVGTGRIHD